MAELCSRRKGLLTLGIWYIASHEEGAFIFARSLNFHVPEFISDYLFFNPIVFMHYNVAWFCI